MIQVCAIYIINIYYMKSKSYKSLLYSGTSLYAILFEQIRSDWGRFVLSSHWTRSTDSVILSSPGAAAISGKYVRKNFCFWHLARDRSLTQVGGTDESVGTPRKTRVKGKRASKEEKRVVGAAATNRRFVHLDVGVRRMHVRVNKRASIIDSSRYSLPSRISS